MKELRIPKRSGGVRIVVVPDKATKTMLRLQLPKLQATAILLDVHGVQHGFTPGRSAVTNAQQHVGYRWTISFDLADCFDHVTEQVASRITQVPLACFHNGVARQGLPTSPAVANIALAPIDAALVNALAHRGAYTRYADDLTISTNDRSVIDEMRVTVPWIVANHDFAVNDRKTLIQSTAAGRRHVTGVAVDEHGLHPRRRDKRRLRAALHQGRTAQAAGLAEWCKHNPPSVGPHFERGTAPTARPDEVQLVQLVLARF